MDAENLFNCEISKLKRSVVFKTVQQTLLIVFLIFLGSCAFLLIIQKTGYLSFDKRKIQNYAEIPRRS